MPPYTGWTRTSCVKLQSSFRTCSSPMPCPGLSWRTCASTSRTPRRQGNYGAEYQLKRKRSHRRGGREGIHIEIGGISKRTRERKNSSNTYWRRNIFCCLFFFLAFRCLVLFSLLFCTRYGSKHLSVGELRGDSRSYLSFIFNICFNSWLKLGNTRTFKAPM